MTDPIRDTQRAAYEDLEPNVSERRMRVLQAIRFNDGMTLFELVEHLKWPVNCISGRVTELADMGKIRDMGLRRINPKSGKKGIVWMAE